MKICCYYLQCQIAANNNIFPQQYWVQACSNLHICKNKYLHSVVFTSSCFWNINAHLFELKRKIMNQFLLLLCRKCNRQYYNISHFHQQMRINFCFFFPNSFLLEMFTVDFQLFAPFPNKKKKNVINAFLRKMFFVYTGISVHAFILLSGSCHSAEINFTKFTNAPKQYTLNVCN